MCYEGLGNKTIYHIIVLWSSLRLSCFELAIERVKKMLPPPFPREMKLAAIRTGGWLVPFPEFTGVLSG